MTSKDALKNHTLDHAIELINDNRLASSDAAPATSVAYYEALAEYCGDRAQELRAEHDVDDDVDLKEDIDG